MGNKIEAMLLFALILALPIAAFAQEQASPAPPGQLALMRIVQLQPGAGAEYWSFMKDEYIPALKKAGVTEFYTAASTMFGQGGRIVTLRPINDLAQLDGAAPLVKALGQQGADALDRKLTKLIASYRLLLTYSRPELSFPPPSSYVPKLIVERIYTVAPGREADFEKHHRNVSEALKNTDLKGLTVARVAIGGNLTEYRSVAWFDSYADIPKLNGARRNTEEAVGPWPAGVITHVEGSTFRAVPEASILPARTP
jgi:hypothetical protein